MPNAPLAARLPDAVAVLRDCLAALDAGQVHPAELLVSHRVGREPEAYKVRSPAARALAQLAAAGKPLRPGQRVRFLYTRGAPGVYAWGLPTPLDPAHIDTARYGVLLRRAAAALLQPLIDEQALGRWLSGEAGQLPLPYSLPHNLL